MEIVKGFGAKIGIYSYLDEYMRIYYYKMSRQFY